MPHDPAGNTPGQAPGVTELANDGRDHGSLHGCRPAAWRGIAVGWISIAGSQRLQVRLKSRCPIGFSLAELDHQIANAQTAREAIEHALRCPHHDIVECPNFASVIAARLAGQPLHQAHSH
jgi:hypothetical protein